MTTSLRVLILEDRQPDAELMAHELRQAGFEPAWQRVETEASYLAQLDEELDVILADYALPRFSALSALHLLRERDLDIPFIIVSGHVSEEAAVECMKQGAADYLFKDRLARLGPAVGRALEEKALRDEKRQAEEALRESEARYRQLFEQTQAALAETEALYRVSRSLIGFESLSDLLQSVVDGVAEALDADRVTLITSDLATSRTTHFVKGGPGVDNVVQVSFNELMDGLSGWVLRQLEPALSPQEMVPDPRESPRVQQRRVQTNCGALMVVPLRYRNQTLGTMTAINRPDQRNFTERDVELMTAMANQTAVAIENARLFEEAQQEIAERRRAEETLRASRQRYRSLFDGVPVGLYRTTPEGEILDANPALVTMLGYPNREILLTVNALDLYVDPEERARWQSTMERDEMVHNFKTRLRQYNGTVIWVEDNARLVRDVDSRVLHYEGSLRNITERKQAEAEREALIAELETKNAELERFVYTVSHDLKSPLITIRGFLGFLEQAALEGDVEQVQADMDRITSATDKMHQLLNELLELSRIGRLMNPPEEVSFGELAHEALSTVAGRLREGGVEVEIAPDLPVVRGDRARLREVIENLIDNAVKYMGNQPNPRIEIGARRDGEETILYVRDNGIGIDPRYHSRVFELFEKLNPKAEGTGVGLAIVKRIVEVHGGRIWVESGGAGKGSAFCFTLPEREM